MCYPVPGPRCSAHSYAELIDAEVKYARCTDPALKLILGARLEEKRTVYETTPKGQNELRRNADVAGGIEREELLLRLQKGEATRDKQLKEYHHMVKNKANNFISSVEEKGYTRGRYQDACGIAAIFLTERFKEESFHASNLYTVISDKRKVFVLAEKYVGSWGEAEYSDKEGYITEDILLRKIFKESLNLSTPSPNNEKLMMSWFAGKLKTEGYTDVAAVNRKTEDVVVLPVDRLGELYSVKFRLKRRVGGTTSYRGNVVDLTQYIVGTVFEEGRILQPEKTYKTVIYGVPPQARKDCILSEEIFLSWRDPIDGEEGYFEVRKKHLSSNFDIMVILQRERDIEISGVRTRSEKPQTEEDDVQSNQPEIIEEQDVSLPKIPSLPMFEPKKPLPSLPKFVTNTVTETGEPSFASDSVEEINVEDFQEPENQTFEEDEYTQLESYTEDEYTQDDFSQVEPEETPPSSPTPKSNIWF